MRESHEVNMGSKLYEYVKEYLFLDMKTYSEECTSAALTCLVTPDWLLILFCLEQCSDASIAATGNKVSVSELFTSTSEPGEKLAWSECRLSRSPFDSYLGTWKNKSSRLSVWLSDWMNRHSEWNWLLAFSYPVSPICRVTDLRIPVKGRRVSRSAVLARGGAGSKL